VHRLEPVAPVYNELARRGTPVVVLGHRAPFCEQFANVETDDVAASFAMTQHLLELGHRRIAFFAGPPTVPPAQKRIEAYRRALRPAGYGDVLAAEDVRVPLTTLAQPKFRLGAAAMDLMLRLLPGEAPSSTRLSAEIVIRQSSGPPPPAPAPAS